MIMFQQILHICLLTAAICYALASSNSEVNRLFEDLFENYNKLARPVRNPLEAISIHFKFKLLQLLDVRERDQVIMTNGWLIHNWIDYRLTWNPLEYGNATMIHIPGELIWLPDIILYNNAHGSPAVASITKADVYWNGKIVWEPPVIYNSLCKMDIEWFPYDEQYCDMKLGSWTYGSFELDMAHLETDQVESLSVGNETSWRVEMGIDISEYVENVEWDLLSVVGTRNERRYPCCDYPVVDITYSLNIRRKKLFYTINLMIPCIGIATLTSFVFYLPSESHNKIQLCISVLVSLTIFILLLVEIVPPTSLVTPLIGKYLLFTMILVNLSTVLSVIVENVHYRRDQPMAKWVRSIFIHFLGKYILIFRRPGNPKFHRQARYKRIPTLNALRLLDDHFKKDLSLKESKMSANKKLCRSFTDGIYNEIMNHQPTQNYTNDVPIEFKYRASLIGINIRYIEKTLKKIRQQEELQADWRFVAMVIDRIMLILFTVTIIGGTLLATTSAPSLRDQRVPL